MDEKLLDKVRRLIKDKYLDLRVRRESTGLGWSEHSYTVEGGKFSFAILESRKRGNTRYLVYLNNTKVDEGCFSYEVLKQAFIMLKDAHELIVERNLKEHQEKSKEELIKFLNT